MKELKLKEYRTTIDTIMINIYNDNIESEDILNEENRGMSELFKAINYKKRKDRKDQGKISLVIKIHNIYRDRKLDKEFYVESYGELIKTLDKLYYELGIRDIEKLELQRVDIAIDRPGTYSENLKETRYLYHLLNLDFKDKELWYNTSFRKNEINTFMAKGRSFELSFYDKESESGGQFPYKTRYEFRFKRISKNDLEIVLDRLIKRLERLEENIPYVEKESIKLLTKLYDEEKEKNISLSLSEFVRHNDMLIYTNKVMQALYEHSELNGSYKKWKENYRKLNRLEFISNTRMKKIIYSCKAAIKLYKKS